MDPYDDIRIYNGSCPPFKVLLQKIKRRPETRLGIYDGVYPLMPVDRRYAAGIWKRLFLIALNRMATEQPSLARFTAVEALNVLGSSSSPSQIHPTTEPVRYLLMKLKRMKAQKLRGRTSPKNGFHPLDIQSWISEGVQVFKKGVNRQAAADLWKRCGGNRMPENLIMELRHKRTPRGWARTFVARLIGVDEDGLKVTLSRQRRAQKRLQ